MNSLKNRRRLQYEPRRFRLGGAWIALITCGTPAFVLFIALSAPWRYLAAALTLAPAPWAVRRAFRISLTVTDEEVTIKNYWRSYTVAWSDVEGVGVALREHGLLPQPALAFKLRDGAAVFAQATPFRQTERRAFHQAVLELAPSTVVELPDAAGPVGSDRAPTNILRQWWLKGQPTQPSLGGDRPDQIWREASWLWPSSLLTAALTFVVSALLLVAGISVLIGVVKDDANVARYAIAALLIVAAGVGCLRFVLLLKRQRHNSGVSRSSPRS
jgi:hypothetical protein